MPKKSKHTSHLLMIIGAVFAILLISAGIIVPRKKVAAPQTQQTIPDPAAVIQGQQNENVLAAIAVDSSNWKEYKDPTYRFSIKYPPEWADPETQKINDPDYEYEYEADFGTKETLSGNGFEGFSVFIFRTEKCPGPNGQGAGGQAACATKKTKLSTGANLNEGIIEFSTITYTYTVVPYIPPENADPDLARKTSLEFEEAGKTFQYDPTLKIVPLPKPQKTTAKPVPSKQAATSSKPASSAGRRGKLTGAVSSGGRLVCPHPNRKPQKSPNQGNHVDEDCCPDPDEWPNIACSYRPADYKIMLKP